MENYRAKHQGLIPVIFVTCHSCGRAASYDSRNLRCIVSECPSNQIGEEAAA